MSVSEPPQPTPAHPTVGTTATKRCQWCSALAPSNAHTCPSCGSLMQSALTAGDRSLAAADLSLFQESTSGATAPAPLPTYAEPPYMPGTSTSWTDTPRASRGASNPFKAASGVVGICVALGALVLPYLLIGPFSNLTGVEDVQASNLRALGSIIGLLIGMSLAVVLAFVSRTNSSGR